MADKNWPRGRGEAANLSNLKITTRYLDSDYQIFEENLTRGETGLLRVFSLIPKTPGKPRFRARVDDGSPAQRISPELDIDIEDVTESIRRDFKASRNGYVGHHTNRSPNSQQRIFEVEIAIPSSNVFQGDVFFNVAFSVGASMTTQSSLKVDGTVIRAHWPTRFRNWLKQLWHRIRSLF